MKAGCMSTNDATVREPVRPASRRPTGRWRRRPVPRFQSPIVPQATISARALVAVVAIMTFLASLTTGAVMLVRTVANDWQSEVAREVTIQMRPAGGRDIEADIVRAAAIARTIPGIGEVRPYSKEETARLLEPWLGTGLRARRPAGAAHDRGADYARHPTRPATIARRARHRGAVGQSRRSPRLRRPQMRTMARAAILVAACVLALVLIATVLSVTFATRAAMATNQTVIEVLHLIGAKNGFIAEHFQRHFLELGLKGGAIGGAAAVVVFVIAELLSGRFQDTADGSQVGRLVRRFLDWAVGLCRRDRAGRLDRARDRRYLALHRQPYHREPRVTLAPPLLRRNSRYDAGGYERTAMSLAGPKSDNGSGEMPDPAGRTSRRWPRRLGRSAVVLGVTGGVLLAAGFIWFLWAVPNDETPLTHDADGIVVLTGGASRINDAIELMAAGRGKRLLISGLPPQHHGR